MGQCGEQGAKEGKIRDIHGARRPLDKQNPSVHVLARYHIRARAITQPVLTRVLSGKQTVPVDRETGMPSNFGLSPPDIQIEADYVLASAHISGGSMSSLTAPPFGWTLVSACEYQKGGGRYGRLRTHADN